jgi:hypothetical protein
MSGSVAQGMRRRRGLAVGTTMDLKDAFSEALEQSLTELVGNRISFFDWALRVPEPKRPLDFDQFPMQRELYQEGADEHRTVVMKGTQVGVSAWALRWMMYHADTRGLTGLYLLPRTTDVFDFCIDGDERVLMVDGTTRAMRDVRPGDRVMSGDAAGVREDVVEDHWASGVRSLVVVEMAGGRRVRCTREHRLLTRRGWVSAGDLSVNDEVCVPSRLPSVGLPGSVDDAFLLALWLAEGTKKAAGYAVTCGNQQIRDRAKAVAASRGWEVYEGSRLYFRLLMRPRRNDASPGALLRRYDVRGMTTNTIRVPDAVMRSEHRVMEEFLRTYVACDGSVAAREVTICSNSERMVRDLQLLAARLSIQSTVRKGLTAWTWATADLAAMKALGVLGKPVTVTHRDARRSRPATATNLLHHRVLDALGRQSDVATALGISQAAVCRMRQRTRDAVGPSAHYWSRVREVRDDGLGETYDLRTRTHSAFFVEGALTHNSDARIRPVIQNSEYLKARIEPEDPSNKGLRKLGLGIMYFRGSESKRGLDTADVDAMVLDEYDTLNQENIPDAERRLSGITSANLLRRVGVPSIPNWGISKMYEDSDQRKWMVKCGCGDWQSLTFHDNVDQTTESILCRECHRPLDVGTGQWVATYPDREIRGYHVTRLCAPGANLHDIIVASKQRLPHQRQTFFNKDLGEPFAPAEGRLSREVIASCVREFSQEPGYTGMNVVTMGVDVASTRALNIRISEQIDDVHRKALCIREVDNFDELALLMDRYCVKMAVIDHLPEGRLARSFAERFAGRVMIVAYNTNPSPKDDKVIKVDEAARMVSARRVESMDATAEQFRQQNNLLPLDLPHGYIDALQAPVRHVEEDQLGRKTVSYRSMGQDDFFHAEVYDLIASEVFIHRQITDELQRTTLSSLDDHLEFQRSGLSDYDRDDTYNPGGRDHGDY